MDLEAARQLLPDFDLTEIVPLDGGEVHANYGLETAAGRRLVLKVYRGELSWKRDKEVFLLELVAGHVPAPEIVYTTQGFLVMTRLPGRPARFTDDDPVETSRQLGGLLQGASHHHLRHLRLHRDPRDQPGANQPRIHAPPRRPEGAEWPA